MFPNEMNDNITLLTDSYKVGHWPQYPPGTTNVYSYFESRGGAYPATVFFGLQYVLDTILSKRVSHDDIREAAELYAEHFGSTDMFNRAGWEYISNRYGGLLPVRIKAVPEGSVIPTHNVLMTIENTDPKVPWLTNYLETILSQVWYPTTVATISHFVREKIAAYLEETGDEAGLDFKLHDFGFRGASSLETAALGAAAHLTSFLGTDTIPGLLLLRKHYGAKEIAGFSVPASEHSTMTAWGREHEQDAYANMIETYGSYPYYSVVADSYNIYEAVKMFGGPLKDQVLAQEGSLVIRPDSGDPSKVVIELLDLIMHHFGATKNSKGYLVLNPKVRLIWGDGLEPKTIESILFRMRLYGWSAENIVFGMGGGLLQKVNRDTQKFAFKASSVEIDGKQHDVWKSPVGDTGKNSKRGRLGLYHNADDGYTTQEEGYNFDLLETVFEDGVITKRYTLDEIRVNSGMRAEVAA